MPISQITSASIATNTITSDDMSSTAQYYGFKNRIINGAMMIDQRNAGASVSATNSVRYTVDRFACFSGAASGAGVFTVQQVSDAPAGFTRSLRATVTTADTTAVGDSQYFIAQYIEGNNIADLGFGSASASTITISFWVKSSLTGTFAGGISNSAANRSYVFTYAISSANTWEYKTITIAGDTTGTWLTDSGMGMRVNFSLGSGSIFQTTAGAWAATYAYATSSSVRVIGTLNATFQITGVQLEKGSVATSFDFRPIGTELMLCQRYAYTTSGGCSNAGAAASTTTVQQRFNFPVVMRATPTTSITLAGSFGISDDYNTDYTATTVTITQTRASTIMARLTLGGFTGLTTGRLCGGVGDTGTAQITFSAEL